MLINVILIKKDVLGKFFVVTIIEYDNFKMSLVIPMLHDKINIDKLI